jgi:glutaredoxin
MLMNKHGIEFDEKHLRDDGLQRFKDVTKLDTLPQIYDGKDNHIGGYQELLAHLEN